MGDDQNAQPVMLEYARAERPLETRAQRLFQGCFVALITIFGLLCLFDGSRVSATAFLGAAGFFAAVMFFPIHHQPREID